MFEVSIVHYGHFSDSYSQSARELCRTPHVENKPFPTVSSAFQWPCISEILQENRSWHIFMIPLLLLKVLEITNSKINYPCYTSIALVVFMAISGILCILLSY